LSRERLFTGSAGVLAGSPGAEVSRPRLDVQGRRGGVRGDLETKAEKELAALKALLEKEGEDGQGVPAA
jgi:hypothetical protein